MVFCIRHLVDRLMRESTISEFEPTRPGSAHDPRHCISPSKPNVYAHLSLVASRFVPSLPPPSGTAQPAMLDNAYIVLLAGQANLAFQHPKFGAVFFPVVSFDGVTSYSPPLTLHLVLSPCILFFANDGEQAYGGREVAARPRHHKHER